MTLAAHPMLIEHAPTAPQQSERAGTLHGADRPSCAPEALRAIAIE
jgi:hypothetical protein